MVGDDNVHDSYGDPGDVSDYCDVGDDDDDETKGSVVSGAINSPPQLGPSQSAVFYKKNLKMIRLQQNSICFEEFYKTCIVCIKKFGRPASQIDHILQAVLSGLAAFYSQTKEKYLWHVHKLKPNAIKQKTIWEELEAFASCF